MKKLTYFFLALLVVACSDDSNNNDDNLDTTAPVITVTPGTDTVEQGSTWADAGATSDGGENSYRIRNSRYKILLEPIPLLTLLQIQQAILERQQE